MRAHGLRITVWAGLAGFVASGEVGNKAFPWGRLVLVGLARGSRPCAASRVAARVTGPHAWSHQAAVSETARQTAAIYRIDWGGGVFTSTAYSSATVADDVLVAFQSRQLPATAMDSAAWGLRTFYFVIIVNAAIVFARPPVRPFGLLLTALLMWAWRPAHPRPF